MGRKIIIRSFVRRVLHNAAPSYPSSLFRCLSLPPHLLSPTTPAASAVIAAPTPHPPVTDLATLVQPRSPARGRRTPERQGSRAAGGGPWDDCRHSSDMDEGWCSEAMRLVCWRVKSRGNGTVPLAVKRRYAAVVQFSGGLSGRDPYKLPLLSLLILSPLALLWLCLHWACR